MGTGQEGREKEWMKKKEKAKIPQNFTQDSQITTHTAKQVTASHINNPLLRDTICSRAATMLECILSPLVCVRSMAATILGHK